MPEPVSLSLPTTVMAPKHLSSFPDSLPTSHLPKTLLSSQMNSSTDHHQPPSTSLKQTATSAQTSVAVATDDADSDEVDPSVGLYDPKKERISALSARSTKYPSQHIKFTSAETESNTHANAYTFGSSTYNSPLNSPGQELGNFTSSDDLSDFDDIDGGTIIQATPSVPTTVKSKDSCMRKTPDSHHRVRGSRSRSAGGFNGSSRAGATVEGHFIDPNSPSAAFAHRVAFDTFGNKYATDFSLTLQSKHQGYKFSRLSRTFMCGTDKNKYSENALSWLMEKLVEDGDEVLCLRVIDPSSKISSSDKALEEKQYQDEAHKFLEHMISKNTRDKKISLILEYAVGGVEDRIKRMIQLYEPSILIVGTKGRSIEGFKGLLPGSVSKWCLQHSPIPVVVVKPVSKRELHKSKREADPHQLSYLDMVAAHPDERPTIYEHMSSSSLLAPQLPMYLQRDFASTQSSMVSSMESSVTSLIQPERVGRFDRELKSSKASSSRK